jgi:GDP-4-dehydro-6-deoxy-D-mannose reductase
MAVWLVTGATGFVGRHVLAALQAGVAGSADSAPQLVVLGRRCPQSWPRENFISADLTAAGDIRQAIAQAAPDFVIHTAGKTPPAPDDELYRANFWATIHLLSALRLSQKPVRVVLSGSAAELGPVDTGQLPVDETYRGYARDAYGRSKWLATSAGLAERGPLEIVVARVFNPIGPGTPPTQALGRFADKLADPGPDPLDLEVGDLDVRRDFVDVRDVARAMIALALAGRAGLVYNVGTGQSRRVGDGLERLIHLSGRTVRVRVDPALQARRGPPDSRASITRIVSQTTWRPAISWDQSLSDLWNEVVARKQPTRIDHEAAA